ncbi:MAG: ECF transporter S component [Bacilli bacterium]|nr:ECF transporter S component [Bacilli bacterium]
MKQSKFDVKFIARTAIFAAISIILYLVPVFSISLPIFPSFLKIHFDEIPALIAGFAYGPLSGVIVIVVKTLAKLPLTNTMAVGELADLLYSVAFIVPASLLYKKMHNLKGALISIGVGIVAQVIVATVFTTYVMLDFYVFMMGLPAEAILNMCQAVNPNVSSLGLPFLFMISLPFNLLKDAIVALVTMVLYKRLHGLIDKIGAQKN